MLRHPLRQLFKLFLPQRRTISRVTIEQTSGRIWRVSDASGASIFVAHPRRLSQYQAGIAARIERLRKEYCLSPEVLAAGPIVDVGANAGEFFFIARESGNAYFAFEPDPVAFAALKANVQGTSLYEVALGNINGHSPFGLATSGADSSMLIANSSAASSTVSVRVERLDDFAAKHDLPEHVGLLKLEAEGNEPEVLEGAERFLQRVVYVTVDAGPERFGQSTAPQVVNFLLRRGFELKDVYLRRGTFLFRKL